jgi:2-polyprenyl-3-methyl-5-hydroxy-6-metoxy-1,4-benzoquinol methylase
MNDKSSPLQFTGERYLPEVGGNIQLEHLHRYLLAARIVAGKAVLDIACGEGYGSAMLASSAARVTGVDIAPEAVAHAQARYRAGNLEFRQGACEAVPLPDASVDVVVSFETIEHHDQHDAMMREIKRVLKPGGALVMSSPDKLEYSVRPQYRNPHHVRELTRGEFAGLLRAFFRNHAIYGQRMMYGSAILSEGDAGETGCFERAGEKFEYARGVPRAVYLVAVASDAELPLLAGGMLEQPIAQAEPVAVRDAHIAAMQGSLSWKLTWPLRFIARFLRP